MRREQLGELVNLTLHLTAQRPTAEMPAVELDDLLRKDRELHAERVVTAEHFHAVVRHDTADGEHRRAPSASELARGTVRFDPRRSHLKLALGCFVAFAGGLAATLPLWW